MRYSVTEALGLSANKPSSTSSSSSITKSTKSKSLRARNRMCLVLYAEEDSTTILLIAHFSDVDPASDNPDYPVVFPELSRFDLLHNLLSIHLAVPVGGRRSIQVESPPTSKKFSSDINHYLVLKPVKVPIGRIWPIPTDDYVSINEMLFINEVVHDLLKGEKQKLILRDSQMIQNTIRNDDVDDDSEKDGGESADSNPTARCLIELMGKELCE